jgi:hypothetical protein
MLAFVRRLFRRFRKPAPVDPVAHYARETLREIWTDSESRRKP